MFAKILLTIVIILVVGYGLRWLGGPAPQPPVDDPNRDNGRSDTPLIDDMEECATCKTWVTKSDQKDCGKKNCPYS